jgi:cell division protein FtsQ
MRRRPPRRALLAAAAVLVALCGAFLIVRDSSLVAVERVAVRGASGPDAPKVEATLRQVARDMTTLNADADRLREAVEQYPTVDDVALDRNLPHDLTVTVLERRAVGVVVVGGRRVPVTADGRLLRGATPPEDLPVLGLRDEPADRVDDARGRRLLAVLAAAPEAIRRKARRVYLGANGLTLAMRKGPSLYFGTTADLRAKWTAAARVLADPTAEGARYVDVRVPERAAAGGLAPLVAPEDDLAASALDEPAQAVPETPAPPGPPAGGASDAPSPQAPATTPFPSPSTGA